MQNCCKGKHGKKNESRIACDKRRSKYIIVVSAWLLQNTTGEPCDNECEVWRFVP